MTFDKNIGCNDYGAARVCYLYFIECKGNVIKFGKTCNPYRRLCDYRREMSQKEFRVAPDANFEFLWECTPNNVHELEQHCLSLMREHFLNVRREGFILERPSDFARLIACLFEGAKNYSIKQINPSVILKDCEPFHELPLNHGLEKTDDSPAPMQKASGEKLWVVGDDESDQEDARMARFIKNNKHILAQWGSIPLAPSVAAAGSWDADKYGVFNDDLTSFYADDEKREYWANFIGPLTPEEDPANTRHFRQGEDGLRYLLPLDIFSLEEVGSRFWDDGT